MKVIFNQFLNTIFGKNSILKTQEWKSLRKVLFTLSFLIAASVGLLVAISELNKRQSIIDLIDVNNKTFHQIISIHAGSYNYSVIEILSQNQLQRDEIKYIQVIDDIGFIVFDNRPPTANADNTKNIINITMPLLLNDNTVSEQGHVLVGYEIPALSIVVFDAIKNALLVYLIVFTSTIFILTYYINKFVSIPIQHLTDSIRESRRTKNHVTTELSGDTKLGRLAEEYNAMQTELNKYREDVDRSRKLKMLGTVVGGVAHEFNNFLAVILSSIDMIKLEDSKSDKLPKRLDLIESSARNATNIVSKLLATKNISKGTQEISDLGEILDSIANLSPSFYDPGRITLDISYDENFYICCHESELLTAIINLIKNASQAMHETGDRISVTCKRPAENDTQHHMAPEGDFCVLTVTDNGPGVAKDLQDRLFEPFFTTKFEDQGTGLGLWCLYELITAVDGFVFYTDAKPSGAIFTLYIPTVVYTQSRKISQPRLTDNNVSLSNIKVLIVEDEKNLVKIFQQYLLAKGAFVDCASTCKDAMGIIKQKQFDVIVCDLNLPDGDGIEVCRLSKEIYADILSILISGNPVAIDKDENPFDFIYTKPVPLGELSTVIYSELKK